MQLLLLSIIEAIYLSYTFHFLKTSVDFNIIDSPSNVLFKHPIGNDKVCRVCPFGQYAIVALITLIILRNFIYIIPQVIISSISIAILISVINLNAFIYLIPFAVIEFLLYWKHLPLSSD